MSFFPSIPNLELLGLFKKFPERGVLPLLEYHDEILRVPSELSEGERELIAAYVSSLNGCHYCYNAHKAYAMAFGIEEEVFGEMILSLDHASIPAKMMPVFKYVRRLTKDPAGMSEDDADAIYAAGFSEEGLYDIISVTALYNFMNRILEGAGIKKHKVVNKMSDEMRRKFKYADLWNMIKRK